MTTAMLHPSGTDDPVAERERDALPDLLSPRELEVLALMAEGRSNRAICEQLGVELKTVETHIGRVFTKLGLHDDQHANRRVRAVLTFLGRDRAAVAV
jgi:DNA-binding NarL/FixJ family response regulator